MKSLIVVKAGSTFSQTRQNFGDFDEWTCAGLGTGTLPRLVIDGRDQSPLPSVAACAGVVITGSHAMVTDKEPWSVRLEEWIRELIAGQVPFFGICYGHQLLAAACGGQVAYHPAGKEIGTVSIERLPAADADPLFAELPADFVAHVTHAQTVVTLPPGSVRLAANAFEPNHAFRLGPCAWGVQFHPEYTPAIMRHYIDEQAQELAAAGQDVTRLRKQVAATPVAAEIFRRFGHFCEKR